MTGSPLSYNTFSLPTKYAPGMSQSSSLTYTSCRLHWPNPTAKLSQDVRFTRNTLQLYYFPLWCLHYATSLSTRTKLYNPETQAFCSALSFTACENLEEHRAAVNKAITALYSPFGQWTVSTLLFDFCSFLQDLQLDLRSMVRQVEKGFQVWQNIIALHSLLSWGISNRFFFPLVDFPLTHQHYLWVIPAYSSYLWTDNYSFKLTSKYRCSWEEHSYLINDRSHGKRNQIHRTAMAVHKWNLLHVTYQNGITFPAGSGSEI